MHIIYGKTIILYAFAYNYEGIEFFSNLAKLKKGLMKMKKLLWLDDVRNPMEGDWLSYSPISHDEVIWVKSYNEFIYWIKTNGLPDAICFDHDLGMDIAIEARTKGKSKSTARKLKQEEKTGHDCAKWLVEYCMDNNKEIPQYNIQSANPVGKENIDGLLKNFIQKYERKNG